MYPHQGFYICPSCGVCRGDKCVIGYNESCTKRENVFYKRDEYFQPKIGKFLRQEPLKIPDSVMRLLEGQKEEMYFIKGMNIFNRKLESSYVKNT